MSIGIQSKHRFEFYLCRASLYKQKRSSSTNVDYKQTQSPTQHYTFFLTFFKGDSGGPLQVPSYKGCPNTYELIGVTAAVENRKIKLDQTLLSFYTRVDYFIPWIASHVWTNEPD